MEERIKDEVIYYYDWHPTEEDLMGESNPHLDLVTYLVTLLRYLFRDRPSAVYGNLNFYQTRNPQELPLVPDVAVIKGATYDPFATSWKVGRDGPAPQVVFELLSEGTWERDLTEKPLAYARMGVQEYFAYDPQKRPLASATERLFGWRLSPRDGLMLPLSPQQHGSLWSVELDSRLVPDGRWLRLSDRSGQLRLTEAETERQQRELATQRAQIAEQQARAEAQRARIAEQQARAEAQRAQAEAQRAQAAERRARLLAEKLRALGLDPDQEMSAE